jgi:hypothetical protein
VKYLIALKNAALIIAVLLINAVAFSTHTSAMPAMSHEMNGGMKHSSSDSASCATLCRTAVFSKDESVDSDNDEENDEPAVPFYVQSQSWLLGDTQVNQRKYADSVKPPPKIPIYILYGVFRV